MESSDLKSIERFFTLRISTEVDPTAMEQGTHFGTKFCASSSVRHDLPQNFVASQRILSPWH